MRERGRGEGLAAIIRLRHLLAVILLLWLVQPAAPPRSAFAQEAMPAAYAPVAENAQFALDLDPSTLAFKLLDKRSGYVWQSGLDEPAEGDRLNTSWRAFARSGISIEILDERATNRRVSIANSETTIELTRIDQGVSARVTFVEYGITVGVNVQLEAEGVRVEVPFAAILEEDPAFRLRRVFLYPFLGATRGGSVPGYMVLPDGTGSLIRFADSTRAENMFYGRYYGPDLGMSSAFLFDDRVSNPRPLQYPVFGLVRGEGEHALLSVVERGAAYGELQIHPAGIITNFNFLYHAFVYNQAYFQATNRAGAGVTTVQRQPNRFDAVIHYRFLTGGDSSYIGIARSYQQYLVERGLLHRADFSSADIGVRLEFLGGDKERVALWDRFVPMTTIEQVRAILADLAIPNPEVIYYGWQPLGASNLAPTALEIEAQLGSVDDLRALAEQVESSGGHFSLYLDPQMAAVNSGGYSERGDVAMSITNQSLRGFNRLLGYYLTYDTLERRYRALAQSVQSQLGVGLAIDTISFVLYSDFRAGHTLNRQEMAEAYRSLFADSTQRLGFYRPNDYLLPMTQAYYDMPHDSNGYIYTSEPVPFLPIVLSGYVPYYGVALNFSSNMQDDLLRHIEYGISPSYFVTQAPTANMLNTPSSLIYTSSYAQWGEEIRQTYARMNALLAPVRGQAIVDHARLAEDVYATTYASGQRVVVNYGDSAYVVDGVAVEAKSALLLEDAS